MTTLEKYEKYLIGNYGKRTLVFDSASGCVVQDTKGKKYLDFGGGIAVLSLGHCNKNFLNAMFKQAVKLGHCSNLYMNKPQGDLAEALVHKIGDGKVFFCNSGAEANEALLKLARLHGEKITGEKGKKYKVISAKNSFHGRTLATLSATGQEKIQKGFYPLVEGFSYADYNDLSSFEKAISSDTAAVIIEPIQGESGIFPADKKFLMGLEKLCKKYNALLLFDEVQSGVSRTGKFLACQNLGVQPDALSLAKGLGGGFPLGAIWVAKKYSDLFSTGSHGTTFGGSALACACGLAVLKEIKSKNLESNAENMGAFLIENLKNISKKFPEKIKTVRGIGLMIGVLFAEKYLNIEISKKLTNAGLILVPAGANALRFLPPLNVKKNEIAMALKIFESVIEKI